MFMTRLLLGEAEKKPLQYTFLTPQDTSEITQAEDLTILRFVHCINQYYHSFHCQNLICSKFHFSLENPDR